MAKQSGLGDNFFVAGYDMSGDTNSLQRVGGGPATFDVTSIDKSGYERIGGLRGGEMAWTSYFNPTAAKAHARYSPLPTTDVICSYFRGTALAGPAASIVALQLDYAPQRGNDGMLTFAVPTQSNGYALEWGLAGTAGMRTDTAATNGTAIDLGALWSASFGLQAYLHVFAFTGTSVTVKIQSSSDNAVGDPYADVTGGGFTAATTITSQRIATSNTLAIERYLRVVTTGTFSNAVFAVTIHPNATATAF